MLFYASLSPKSALSLLNNHSFEYAVNDLYAHLDDHVGTKNLNVLLFYDKNQLVGTIFYAIKNYNEAVVHLIEVIPSRRRRHFGSEMVRCLMDKVKPDTLSGMIADDKEALSFWKSLGVDIQKDKQGYQRFKKKLRKDNADR